MSYSRGGWVELTALARWMRSSVVLPMALTTATTSAPCRRVRAMWSATARILSASPTEVPPNFWTTSGIRTRLPTVAPASGPTGAPAAPRCRAFGERRPPRGLGRVCARAQRETSPSARGPRGPSGRRGPAREAPPADPQRRHRGGRGRRRHRHRLRRHEQQQARRVPVEHPTTRPRRPGRTPSCRRRRTRSPSRPAARPAPRRRPTTRRTRSAPADDDRHDEELLGHGGDHRRARSTSR